MCGLMRERRTAPVSHDVSERELRKPRECLEDSVSEEVKGEGRPESGRAYSEGVKGQVRGEEGAGGREAGAWWVQHAPSWRA